MNHVIWKQILSVMPNQSLSLPEKAVILTVQYQNGNLCLWYKCDPNISFKEERHFHMYGTGHPVLPSDDTEQYIATVQQESLVWHIYESPTY